MVNSVYRGVSSLLQFGAKVAMQVAAPVITTGIMATLSLAARNHSVGKIVGGVSCILGGSYIFVKSGVVQFTSCKWLRQLQHEPKNKQPTSSIRTACAVTGVAMVTLGFTSIIIGAKELYDGTSEVDLLPDQSLDQDELLAKRTTSQAMNAAKPHLASQSLFLRSQPRDGEVTQRVLNKLLQCPAGANLVRDVQSGGGFTIQLGSRDEIPSLANWEPAMRSVRILRDLEPDDNKLTQLTFELCNAKTASAKQIAGGTACRAGDLSQLEFMRRSVEAEYESTRCHHEVVSTCVTTNKWPQWTDFLREKFTGKKPAYRTIESAWLNYQNDPYLADHRSAVQAQWLQACKGAYCKKHPEDSDCSILEVTHF